MALGAAGVPVPVAGKPILVALSQSSESLAYLDESGALRVVDTQSGNPKYSEWILEPRFARQARQLSVSNDGAVVAFLAHEDRVHIFDLRERSRERFEGIIQTFALSDDGRYLVVKDYRQNVSLLPASAKEVMPLSNAVSSIRSSFVGRLAFVPGSVRQILDSPSSKDQDNRLKLIAIHKATEVSQNEEIGFKELSRRQFLPVGLSYPSRVLEVSADFHRVLSLGHSIAEVTDLRNPETSITFANSGVGRGHRYDPIETATLSTDGSRFAVVYSFVTVVAESADGATIDILRSETHAAPRMLFGSVAARFTPSGNELVVARAHSEHSLMRFPLPPAGCSGAVAAEAK